MLPSLNCVNITELLLPKWASVSLFGKSRLPPTCEERPGRARLHTQLREEAPSALATISNRALPGMSVLKFPSGPASSSAYRCSLPWWNRPLRQSCGCSRRWGGGAFSETLGPLGTWCEGGSQKWSHIFTDYSSFLNNQGVWSFLPGHEHEHFLGIFMRMDGGLHVAVSFLLVFLAKTNNSITSTGRTLIRRKRFKT